MNWRKAKTILIVALLISNLALLFYLVVNNSKTQKAEQQIINTAIELLNKNGVSVDDSLLKSIDAPDSLYSIDAKNIITDYRDFAFLLLGDETVADSATGFSSPTGKISFTRDSFSAEANSKKVLWPKTVNEKNAIDTAFDYLLSLGFDAEKKDMDMEKDGNKFIVTVKKTENELPVFDCSLTLTLDFSGIVAIKGCWFNTENIVPLENDAKSIAAIFVDYMQKRNKITPCTVTQADFGYSTLDFNTYHQTATFFPVWKIYNSDSETLYIDAKETI